MPFSRSIRQPAISTSYGRFTESVEDFIKNVRLSFTHVEGACTKNEDNKMLIYTFLDHIVPRLTVWDGAGGT